MSALRILLAEDNVTNQKIALFQLEALGYRADVVGDGAAALQALAERRYDVVLMDVQMAGMDGLAATREICSRWPRTARPRIIALTANALEGDHERCLEAGMDDYLAKPVSREKLAEMLAGVVPPDSTKGESAPGPLLVLVADDNPVNRTLAGAQFAALGYEVDVAANGIEAIEAVDRKPYDVVFMDVQMPHMDGLEATRQICARWAVPRRPRIVGMTADADRETRQGCLAAGMDDCITKPIARADLAKLLSSIARRAPP